jgi:hypothetical protein
MKLHWLWGFFLWVQGIVVNLFCLPWGGDGRQWRLATTSLLPLAWTTACEVFGACPVTRKAPKAVADSGEPP